MPLVRISFLKGKPRGFGKDVASVVYRTMVDTINVPPKDNFQVITEHEKGTLVYDPEYLDIPRTDGVVFVQITLNEGHRRVEEDLFHNSGATPPRRTWGTARGRVRQSCGGEERELVLRERHRPVRRKLASVPPRPNKRLKLAARVDCGMNLSSARRSLSAIR